MTEPRGPRVLNFHRDGFPAGAVDIMRPSIWGNPFILRRGVSRQTVIRQFIEYVDVRLDLQERAKIELAGKDVVCCCAPKKCHGDLWLRVANPTLYPMFSLKYWADEALL